MVCQMTSRASVSSHTSSLARTSTIRACTPGPAKLAACHCIDRMGERQASGRINGPQLITQHTLGDGDGEACIGVVGQCRQVGGREPDQVASTPNSSAAGSSPIRSATPQEHPSQIRRCPMATTGPPRTATARSPPLDRRPQRSTRSPQRPDQPTSPPPNAPTTATALPPRRSPTPTPATPDQPDPPTTAQPPPQSPATSRRRPNGQPRHR